MATDVKKIKGLYTRYLFTNIAKDYIKTKLLRVIIDADSIETDILIIDEGAVVGWLRLSGLCI